MNVISARALGPIPVTRPYLGSEEEQAVVAALRSGWITQGPRVAAFEQKFGEYVGCEHAIAVSSCTTALHLALLAAGVKAGDEVICPSLSFIATANSIAYVGATPVFCDIDLATYNLDPARIEEIISPRTKAILVVHQIGLPAQMASVMAVAAKHSLIVIEDAACAVGSEYESEIIGRPLGLMACFSFHPRKILTTGEGGMITTNDANLASRLRRLRQHAMSVSDMVRHTAKQVTTEAYDEIGFNFRMTDMQAAIGVVQLDRLSGFLERRRYLAKRYAASLEAIEWLQTPIVPPNCRHNFQSYMVRLIDGSPAQRDAVMQELLEKNISARRGIMPIHRERPYESDRWKETLIQTNRAADTTFILPLFHQMTEIEQDYVIESLFRVEAA